jgi:hypothetical protein
VKSLFLNPLCARSIPCVFRPVFNSLGSVCSSGARNISGRS